MVDQADMGYIPEMALVSWMLMVVHVEPRSLADL